MFEANLAVEIGLAVVLAQVVIATLSMLLIPAFYETREGEGNVQVVFVPARMLVFAGMVMLSAVLLYAGQDIRAFHPGWVQAAAFSFGPLGFCMLFGAVALAMTIRELRDGNRYPIVLLSFWLGLLAVYVLGLAARTGLYLGVGTWYFWGYS